MAIHVYEFIRTNERNILVRVRSLQRIRDTFGWRFPDQQPPVLKTIAANEKVFPTRSSLESKQGRIQTEVTLEDQKATLRQQDWDLGASLSDQRKTECGGLPYATFNTITRLDLSIHPYQVYIRHQFLPRDCGVCVMAGLRHYEITTQMKTYFGHSLSKMKLRQETRTTLENMQSQDNRPSSTMSWTSVDKKNDAWSGLCGSGHIIGLFHFPLNKMYLEKIYLQMVSKDGVP